MSYTKTNWQTGDVISKARLNHAEQGIYDNAEDITELKNDLTGNIDDIKSILENDSLSVELSTLTVEQQGFVTDRGIFASPSSASHRIVKMDASNLRSITFNPQTAMATNISFGVIKDSSDEIVTILTNDGQTGEHTFDITPQSGDTLYLTFLNYATTPNPYYSGFTYINYTPINDSYHLLQYVAQSLSDSQKTQARNNIGAAAESDLKIFENTVTNSWLTINLADLETVQNGYVSGAGAFVAPGSGSHKIVKMDASNLRALQFQSNTAYTNSFAFAVLKDANDAILQIFRFDNTTNVQTYTGITPAIGNTLYISWFNWKTTPNPNYDSFHIKDYESLIEGYGEDILNLVNNEVIYHHCVKKPFDFSGKNLLFFGDSITYGYIAATETEAAHQAANPYPKVFAEGVGATYSNLGQSGTTLAETSYGSIYTAIQNATLDGDFVFVSGGVNDWQVGVTEAELETAVTNICDYLSANYTGEVIFITPINEAGRSPITTTTQSLQNVRNVITRIALKYGYSVVQGWEFPFPKKSDDADYIALMFQDMLHPTELGYSMYAQALRNALC